MIGSIRYLVYVMIFIVVVAYLPGIPPHVDFVTADFKPVLPAEGPLAPNNYLDSAERLYENYLIGPESFAVAGNNEFYVSTQNGNIVKIWGKDFENSMIVGSNGPSWCMTKAEMHDENVCGRPLGLRWIDTGHLLIADAYFGIFKMDVSTGKSELIVNSSVPINGYKPLIPDDLDIDDEGNIYWSDASTIADLSNAVIDVMAQPSGRLLKYNIKTKTNEVLIDKLSFANGVQLSPKKDFLLINECLSRQITRYWLKGPKSGTHEIFSERLPGMPDNIRARPEGGYYVSLVSSHNRNLPDPLIFLAKLPAVRRFIVRIMYMVQSVANLFANIFDSTFMKRMVFQILSLNQLSNAFDVGQTCVLEIDESGKIISSLQGYNGVMKAICHTERVGDYLVFGSPYAHFLGRLSVKELEKMRNAPNTPKPKEKDEL